MLLTFILAEEGKTSSDPIWRVPCLSNTFLHKLQALLNVNIFSFCFWERGWGAALLAQFSSHRSKAHDGEMICPKEHGNSVRHNCSPFSVFLVELLFQTRNHCKDFGLSTSILKGEEEWHHRSQRAIPSGSGNLCLFTLSLTRQD